MSPVKPYVDTSPKYLPMLVMKSKQPKSIMEHQDTRYNQRTNVEPHSALYSYRREVM